MVRIAITAAAYEAILATLPTVGVEPERTAAGGYFVWIERRWLDELRRIRRPGEDLSDVIVRIAGQG